MAAVCTWDPAVKGANVTLSNGNLSAEITGLQNAVRATLGRDPAAGGVYQWEDDFPVGNHAINLNLGPTSGMITQDGDITPNQAILLGAHTFTFASGEVLITNNSTWVNGSNIGVNWAGSGGTGNQAHTVGKVYDAANKTLKVYLDGVLKYTLTSVGTDGKLIYPTFGSAYNFSAGTMSCNTTTRFSGGFAYPVAATRPWASRAPGFLSLFR